MQIQFYETSELFVGQALVLAALVLLRYAMRRSAELSAEEKSLAMPLYNMVAGTLSLGIASLLNFVMVVMASSDVILTISYYVFFLTGPILFLLAAIQILGWKYFGMSRPILGSFLVFCGNLIAVALLVLLQISLSDIVLLTNIFMIVLGFIPLVLFLYLTKTTGRITSIALAFLMLSTLIGAALPIEDNTLQVFITLIRNFGASFLAVTFYMPEVQTKIEPIGYGLAYSSFGFTGSILMAYVSSTFLDIYTLIPIFLLMTTTVLAYGTATYTYTRWRERRNPATLALGFYFLLSGFSYSVIAVIGANMPMDYASAYSLEYVNVAIGIFATMFLCLSAFLALDWKRVLLLPGLVALPAIIYIFLFFPQNVVLDNIPYYNMVMMLVQISLVMIPLFLYGFLWWKMKKAGVPNRSRPLFIFVGILLLIFASAGSIPLSELFPSALLTACFIVYWLGITGRADRILHTAK